MAADTSLVANNKQVKSSRKAANAPPAGAFWKKYSPHHEFPLSLSSSVFMHILGFVLLGGFLLAFFGLNHNKELPRLDVIAMDSGGGGHREGVGNVNPGTGVLPSKQEIEDKDQSKTATASDSPNKETLAKPEAKKPDLPINPDSVRRVEPDTAADRSLGAVGDKLRAKINGIVAAGKGKGGSGKGDGQGPGDGTGSGPGKGEGRGNITQREKRQIRWKMEFKTFNGEDYANQLKDLGAILAIPGPNDEYLVIRDLDRRLGPVQARSEDLKDLNRIWWVDDRPESVHSLARALGIQPMPHHIIAFFPQSLEKELLEKELKAFHGKEEDIKETVFRVDRRGGRYEPVVMSVTPQR
jgi:hypothetical protein